MSIPAIAAMKQRAKLRADKRRAKAKRLRAKLPYLTSDGRVLAVPPRWTLTTVGNKLREELHAAIRERDGAVCISCGKTGLVVAFGGGTWQAGHLFAVGPYRALRFHPLNIASQCSQCNSGAPRRGGRMGNHAAYAAAVIRRYGLATFAALDAIKGLPQKWTRGGLIDLLDCLRRGGIDRYTARYFELTGWTVEEKAA